MPGFSFFHGLGDTANLCRLLPLYAARGHQLQIATTPDKRPLIELAGHQWTAEASPVHQWAYPAEGVHSGPERHHQGHKVAANISAPPGPSIGTPADLWPELVGLQTDLAAGLPGHVTERARVQLSGLPRPVCLLHSTGNTDQARKSLPEAVQRELALRWIEQQDGTLILLDWDRRAVAVQHPRVRHLDAIGGADLLGLLALIDQADLLIGVDSGPLHLAGLTRTPALGLWSAGHHPARYLVPRPRTLNLVPDHPDLDPGKRAAFRIVSGPVTAAAIMELAGQLLGPRRYLSAAQPADDVLLQWAVRHFGGLHEKGGDCGGVVDRSRSVDLALRLLADRCPGGPQIVETGTVRQAEDRGAGWSSWLWGLFCRGDGGRLVSIDLDPARCDFARKWLADFGDHVRVRENRGSEQIREDQAGIDLLYLDSCDTDQPEHQTVCLEEVQAALPRLRKHSLVLIDDSPTDGGGQVIGKGGQAVPWLVERGWRVIHRGYQVLLDRGGRDVLPAVRLRPDQLPERPAAAGRPVVYTVLIGDRDRLAPVPRGVEDSGVDFVCLSDRPRPEAVGWDVRKIERQHLSDRLESRRPKCLPAEYFPDAPWSLYLDASVELLDASPITSAANLYGPRPADGPQPGEWWAYRHPERSCLWAEAAELQRLGMADRQQLDQQLARYQAAGMPRDWGLLAGGVLLRRHTPAVIAAGELWWQEICLGTERDQVSLPFVLWRHQVDWGPLNGDLHSCPAFHVRPHAGPASRRKLAAGG